uniref:WHIM1 domain-containing protein n=1 Tax=Globisporangium ultimum (strain ATCC 200006 / CBS 805.95 / DAOM BR144) TaxID=431595 RepID=K3WKR2_GLOUD
ELQDALVNAANPNEQQLALLAELHFKLTRDQMGVKLEKMIQDWEKAVARKLHENWQLEFAVNPMEATSYADLRVYERIRILNALCLWKTESCVEIRKYIATIQQENNTKALDTMRASEIGTDDKGVSYWYFDDDCWVYAEDKPQWQLES